MRDMSYAGVFLSTYGQQQLKLALAPTTEKDLFHYQLALVNVRFRDRKIFLEGFERLSLDAPMAIAITANFENFNTMEEKFCKEIPGKTVYLKL
jgi:hypothetical protein